MQRAINSANEAIEQFADTAIARELPDLLAEATRELTGAQEAEAARAEAERKRQEAEAKARHERFIKYRDEGIKAMQADDYHGAILAFDQALAEEDDEQTRAHRQVCVDKTTRHRIAVVDFKVRGDVGIAEAGESVGALLLTEFGQDRYQLVERSQLEAILAEQMLTMAEVVDNPELLEGKKLAGLRYLVLGDVVKLGNLAVSARLTDITTGEIIQTAKVTAEDARGLQAALGELAKILQMTPEEKKAYLDERQYPALLNDARQKASTKDYDEAIALYQRVLAIRATLEVQQELESVRTEHAAWLAKAEEERQREQTFARLLAEARQQAAAEEYDKAIASYHRALSIQFTKEVESELREIEAKRSRSAQQEETRRRQRRFADAMTAAREILAEVPLAETECTDHQKTRLTEALREADQALAQMPGDVQATALTVRIQLLSKGQAVSLWLRRAEEATKTIPTGAYEQRQQSGYASLAYYNAKAWRFSAAGAWAALITDPTHAAWVHAHMAETAAMAGDAEVALASIRPAIEAATRAEPPQASWPNRDYFVLILARASAIAGDRAAAKSFFDDVVSAIKEDRSPSCGFLDVAVAQAEVGEDSWARQTTLRAIQAAQNGENPLHELLYVAEAQVSMGDISGGNDTFQLAISVARGDQVPSRALVYVAEAQTETGQSEAAKETLRLAAQAARAAVLAAPRYSIGITKLREIAKTQKEIGDDSGAQETCRIVCALAEDPWQVVAAKVQAEIGDFAGALLTASAIREADDRCDAYLDIAREQVKAGKVDDARAAIQRAISANQADSFLFYTDYAHIGVALAEVGDRRRAVEYSRKAMYELEKEEQDIGWYELQTIVEGLAKAGDVSTALAFARKVPGGKERDHVYGDIVQGLVEAGDIHHAAETAKRVQDVDVRLSCLIRVLCAAAEKDESELAKAVAEEFGKTLAISNADDGLMTYYGAQFGKAAVNSDLSLIIAVVDQIGQSNDNTRRDSFCAALVYLAPWDRPAVVSAIARRVEDDETAVSCYFTAASELAEAGLLDEAEQWYQEEKPPLRRRAVCLGMVAGLLAKAEATAKDPGRASH